MNKGASIIITVLASVLLALLIIIAAANEQPRAAEEAANPMPPAVNTEGLCHPVQIVAPPEPQYEMYYTAQDAELIAKTVWGEARGCTPEGQAKVVWTILNRVDDDRFPNTIRGVVTQPDQFYGYSPNFPVTPEIITIVNDVLYRWNAEKNGESVERELPASYLYFTGNGQENVFREAH